MTDSVTVCTVTYNSSELLRRLLDSLFKQTYPISHIVIVDNDSSDVHKLRLHEFEGSSDLITIIWKDNNTGGAGGFQTGLEYAKEQYNTQWFWLMDDDAFPNEDCLEKLLSESNNLENIGFLAPIIYGIDRHQYQLYHARIKKGKLLGFDPAVERIEEIKQIELIDVYSFVGLLVPNRIICECGLPRAEYFIEGDDTDYCYRISRDHNGYLLKDAIINHNDLVNQDNISLKLIWKQYYSYRNSILFVKNNAKGYQKTITIFYTILVILKQMFLSLLVKEYKGFRLFRIRFLTKALFDGLMGSGGKTISLDVQ